MATKAPFVRACECGGNLHSQQRCGGSLPPDGDRVIVLVRLLSGDESLVDATVQSETGTNRVFVDWTQKQQIVAIVVVFVDWMGQTR